MDMHRQSVQSSALQSIGYDAQTHTLELEFKEHSGVWQYFNFKPSAFKKFIQSESLGNFFVTKIKGKYKEQKVGRAELAKLRGNFTTKHAKEKPQNTKPFFNSGAKLRAPSVPSPRTLVRHEACVNI